MQTRRPLCMTSYSKPDGRVVRVLSSSAICDILSILRARNVFNTYMQIEMSHMRGNVLGMSHVPLVLGDFVESRYVCGVVRESVNEGNTKHWSGRGA